jgi:hypothetical protein
MTVGKTEISSIGVLYIANRLKQQKMGLAGGDGGKKLKDGKDIWWLNFRLYDWGCDKPSKRERKEGLRLVYERINPKQLPRIVFADMGYVREELEAELQRDGVKLEIVKKVHLSFSFNYCGW